MANSEPLDASKREVPASWQPPVSQAGPRATLGQSQRDADAPYGPPDGAVTESTSILGSGPFRIQLIRKEWMGSRHPSMCRAKFLQIPYQLDTVSPCDVV